MKQTIRDRIEKFGAEENYVIFSLPSKLRHRISEIILSDMSGVVDVCEIGSHLGEQTKITLSQGRSMAIEFRFLFLIDPNLECTELKFGDPAKLSLFKCKLEDAMDMLPESAFDLIYSVGAVESVSNYGVVISRLISKLKPGGKLAFTINKRPTKRRILLITCFGMTLTLLLTIGMNLLEALTFSGVATYLLFFVLLCKKTHRIPGLGLFKAIIHSVIFSMRSQSKMSRENAESFARAHGARLTLVDDLFFGVWLFEMCRNDQ